MAPYLGGEDAVHWVRVGYLHLVVEWSAISNTDVVFRRLGGFTHPLTIPNTCRDCLMPVQK